MHTLPCTFDGNGLNMESRNLHTGGVSLVGAPNVGKSTLLNRLLGQQLSIVSRKPQTTRNRILGIYNDDRGQILLFDTPGYFHGSKALDRYLEEQTLKTCAGVDAVVMMMDARSGLPQALLDAVGESRTPVVLAINKIDTLEKPRLLPLIEKCSQAFPFREIVPISALTGEGTDELVSAMFKLLPEGEPLYPDDQLSDLPERFFVGEIIRERILHCVHDEVPHGVAVCIDSFHERPDGLVEIDATIVVERDSHKRIVIGQGGKMLRLIGQGARERIEKFLDTKVFLKTFVRVEKNWTHSPARLDELGYSDF